MSLMSLMFRKTELIVMAIGVWSFQMRDTKLERFLPKNQHTQKKIIEF